MKKLSSKFKTFLDTTAFVFRKNKKIVLPIVGLIVLLGALLGFGFTNKSFFFAGKVNGKYILRREIVNKLISRYGQQAFDELITLRLINGALAKEGIVISEADVMMELARLKDSLGRSALGEVTIEDFAASQGMTVEELQEQLRIQLGVQRYAESRIEMTDEEVATYLEENRDYFEAETEEEALAQAREMLVNVKTREFLNTWVSELKEQAQIVNFL